MKQFWNWYDDLHDTRPGLRFGLFFILAIVLLVLVPVCFSLVGWSADMGQVFGLLIMTVLAWSKTRKR